MNIHLRRLQLAQDITERGLSASEAVFSARTITAKH
jgi:hypothetical protein